jgi:hypothetical protein
VPFIAADTYGVWRIEMFVSLNGGTNVSLGDVSSSPYTFTASQDGTYSFYTVATDNAGNIEAAPSASQMSVVVDSGTVVSSGSGWTFAGGTPHFSGVSVMIDPFAPSDNKSVMKVSSGVYTSDTVAVTPGGSIDASGIWDLSGHGTKIEICFVGGSCVVSTTMGRLTGSTVYAIPWIDFDVSTMVPSGCTQAYLKWTVG